MQGINDWQKALAQAFTKLDDLLAYLELTPADFNEPLDFNSPFKFIVTREFASRMEKKNPRDPLLLQVLPLAIENETVAGYSTDPLAEKQFNPIPGLLHKYTSRVLLTLTPSCPINCRFCFRRHFAYEDNQINESQLAKIFDYIQRDQKINEVILSGGEPLLIKDHKLGEIIGKLAAIPHLTTLRIHTRMPVVLPQRITATFLKILTRSRLTPVLVIHVNHSNEIDAEVAEKLLALKKSGICLLHQAVLLTNINNDSAVLKNLCERLFACGVMPYYLHQLDQVSGTAHFAITNQEIKILQQNLSAALPGYLVPKFVVEMAGKASKTSLNFVE